MLITNTAISFTDRSLKPNVNMAIQQVNGTISGLSSEQLQHADVNLSAKVDGVGPVAITGTINPFSGTQTNDVKISVKDVDLTPASPYSGKFAGYRIAEGKLNMDLAYELVGKKLQSKNVITLDQFTFGEKVNSPDATHLPVRLAIAILKDREGEIVLDVPIEGSLDDPAIPHRQGRHPRHSEHPDQGCHFAILIGGRAVRWWRRGTRLAGFCGGQRRPDRA